MKGRKKTGKLIVSCTKRHNLNIRKLKKSEFLDLMGKKEKPDTNQNHIRLSIFDFIQHPDQISDILDLNPSSVGIKGEKYTFGSSNQNERTREYSHWEFEWKVLSNEFIGDIIEKFIDEIIIPRIDSLKQLVPNCSVQFGIIQYYYDGNNPGICIRSEHTKILSEIGASIDIDIYCLSDQ